MIAVATCSGIPCSQVLVAAYMKTVLGSSLLCTAVDITPVPAAAIAPAVLWLSLPPFFWDRFLQLLDSDS